MRYLMGIDGGGTKTRGVLTDENGVVLADGRTNATNPNDVTLPVSAARLTALCLDLLCKAGLGEADLPALSVFIGVAGGLNHGAALETALRESLPHIGALTVGSDVHILLAGELPAGDGACIICGTGSACFLRRGGELLRIGGWGYLLDSGGSGYDLGRDALEAVLRAYDGRGEATALSDLLSERLGGPVHTRISEIYREGKPYIAACAPSVFKAARMGDAVAEAILDRNARRLAEYAAAAWRHLAADGRTPPEILPVVMGGGVAVGEAPAWQTRIKGLTDPTVPAVYTVAAMPSVFGAVVEARKQLGEGSADFEALRAAFLGSFTP